MVFLFVFYLMKRNTAVEFAAFNRQLARHRVAEEMKFPVIPLARIARTTQRFLLAMILTGQSTYEFRRSIHHLVGVEIQLREIFLVHGKLIEHMLIVARRIWNRAFGFAFPGAHNFGQFLRGLCVRERREQEKDEENDDATHTRAA